MRQDVYNYAHSHQPVAADLKRMCRLMEEATGIPNLAEKIALMDEATGQLGRLVNRAAGDMSAVRMEYEKMQEFRDSIQGSIPRMDEVLNKTISEQGIPDAVARVREMMERHTDVLARVCEQSLGFSTNMDVIASAIGPGSALQEGLATMGPPPEIKALLECWAAPTRRIGEYIVDVEAETSGDSTPAIEPATPEFALPDNVEHHLIQVNRLPIAVLRDVFRNPVLMRAISPRQFEEFVACLAELLGFEDVQVTPRSNDGGRDIIAIQRGISTLYAFECKRQSPNDKVKLETMRALLGSIHQRSAQVNKGILVTTSHFTRNARNFFMDEVMLDGKDFDDVVAWIETIRGGY